MRHLSLASSDWLRRRLSAGRGRDELIITREEIAGDFEYAIRHKGRREYVNGVVNMGE